MTSEDLAALLTRLRLLLDHASDRMLAVPVDVEDLRAVVAELEAIHALSGRMPSD